MRKHPKEKPALGGCGLEDKSYRHYIAKTFRKYNNHVALHIRKDGCDGRI